MDICRCDGVWSITYKAYNTNDRDTAKEEEKNRLTTTNNIQKISLLCILVVCICRCEQSCQSSGEIEFSTQPHYTYIYKYHLNPADVDSSRHIYVVYILPTKCQNKNVHIVSDLPRNFSYTFPLDQIKSANLYVLAVKFGALFSQCSSANDSISHKREIVRFSICLEKKAQNAFAEKTTMGHPAQYSSIEQ